MHVSHLSVLSRKFTPIANSFSPSALTVVRDYLSDSRSKWICTRSSSWAPCRKIPALPQPSLEPNRTNKRRTQMSLPSKCYHLEKDPGWHQGDVLRRQVHRGQSQLWRAWVAAREPRKRQQEAHDPRLERQLTRQEGNWRYLDFDHEGNENGLKGLKLG